MLGEIVWGILSVWGFVQSGHFSWRYVWGVFRGVVWGFVLGNFLEVCGGIVHSGCADPHARLQVYICVAVMTAVMMVTINCATFFNPTHRDRQF